MNFDPIAHVYSLAETLVAGKRLERARGYFAAEALRDCRAVLMAGDGPGRGLEEVLKSAPQAQVTIVEASAGMIAAAKSRLQKRGLPLERVTWVHQDFREWRGSSFDAATAHFFLDCFDPADVERVAGQLAGALKPGGALLIADFRIPERGWRKWRAQLIHALMHLSFRLAVGLESPRLTPPEPYLRAAGLQREGRALFCAGLIYAELWRKPL